VEIEYDSLKAASNRSKHGISFGEAYTVLLDSNALAVEDAEAEGEVRWNLIGMSNRARLLTVIYTLREDTIRLISARRATRKEADYYA